MTAKVGAHEQLSNTALAALVYFSYSTKFTCQCESNLITYCRNFHSFPPSPFPTPSSVTPHSPTANPTLPPQHTGSEFPLVILSLVRSKPRADFEPELVRGDRSWLNEHLGFVTNPHQICVGITRSKHGLIIVGGLHASEDAHSWR